MTVEELFPDVVDINSVIHQSLEDVIKQSLKLNGAFLTTVRTAGALKLNGVSSIIYYGIDKNMFWHNFMYHLVRLHGQNCCFFAVDQQTRKTQNIQQFLYSVDEKLRNNKHNNHIRYTSIDSINSIEHMNRIIGMTSKNFCFILTDEPIECGNLHTKGDALVFQFLKSYEW